MVLYHYTCQHGRDGIGDDGILAPNLHTAGLLHESLSGLVWLTDLAEPWRDALGLTSDLLACDRTVHRYEVDAPHAEWWMSYRRSVPVDWRDDLELATGAMPVHWWVSREACRATYAPISVKPG